MESHKNQRTGTNAIEVLVKGQSLPSSLINEQVAAVGMLFEIARSLASSQNYLQGHMVVSGPPKPTQTLREFIRNNAV